MSLNSLGVDVPKELAIKNFVFNVRFALMTSGLKSRPASDQMGV